jgi:hypothetical protein
MTCLKPAPCYVLLLQILLLKVLISQRCKLEYPELDLLEIEILKYIAKSIRRLTLDRLDKKHK